MHLPRGAISGYDDLEGRAIGDGFINVDRRVGLLAVEEVQDDLDEPKDTS